MPGKILVHRRALRCTGAMPPSSQTFPIVPFFLPPIYSLLKKQLDQVHPVRRGDVSHAVCGRVCRTGGRRLHQGMY